MSDSRVISGTMFRTALFAACLGLLAPACGSSSKKADTAGGGAAGGGGGISGDGTRPEDVDPEGPIPDGDGPDGDGDGGDVGATGPDGDGDVDTDGDGEPDAPPAKIEPPGLDKSAGEVRAAVAKHMQDANAALQADRWDDAILAARKALNEDEVNVRAMVALAHAYYGKGYYDKCEAILDIAVKRPEGGGNAKLHFLFGLTYDKTDRPNDALAAYEKALDASPDYKSALLNVGAKYIDKGRYADAVRVYEHLTGDLKYNSAKAWANLGAAYRGRSADLNDDKQKRAAFLKRAEDAYKRAVNADNKYPASYYNLGLLYLDADPFPGPDGNDMDTLARLERAKTYFNQYRGMPGTDQKLVDEQVTVAEKLYDREIKAREKRKKLEERRKKAEERERKRKAEDAAEGGN